MLDLVVTNCQEKIVRITDGGRLGRSDHNIITVEIIAEIKNKEDYIRKPDWRRANYEGMIMELRGINWQQSLMAATVNEEWLEFKKIIEELTDRYAPVATFRNTTKPKWLTKDISRLLKQKKSAWRIARLYRNSETIARYEQLEKTVKNKIRKAKKSMEKELSMSKDKNGRKFSNYIKSKTQVKISVGPLKNADGNLTAEDSEMATILNDYFSSVFSEEDLSQLPEKQSETGSVFEMVLIDRKKIKNKINKLRGDSAPGPDKINPRMLKELAHEMAEPLRRILNRSLNEGEVPEDWKTATVTPIYKKGAKSDPGNYRPVSLTSVPCCILESIIKDDLMEHLNQNNIINGSQHGFMQGKSCSANLIEFLEMVTIDNGKSADIFYLDFAKAFDKVPRERLLLKLKAKGVTGRIFNWIKTWLTNRTQQVKMGNCSSKKSEVKSGVPQGTVLGPPLFTIFIDDQDDYAVLLDLLMKFADDTKGIKEINGPEDRDNLQLTLDNLCEWARIWGMTFNVKKCKIMHVGNRNPNYEYFMHEKS